MDERDEGDLLDGELVEQEGAGAMAPSVTGSELDDDDEALEVGENEDYVLEEGRRLLADAEAKLAAVERALERLDAGGYGLCEVCSATISPAALTERPSLARCAEHEVPN